MSTSGETVQKLHILGDAEAAVCVDGVCAVPGAGMPETGMPEAGETE